MRSGTPRPSGHPSHRFRRPMAHHCRSTLHQIPRRVNQSLSSPPHRGGTALLRTALNPPLHPTAVALCRAAMLTKTARPTIGRTTLPPHSSSSTPTPTRTASTPAFTSRITINTAKGRQTVTQTLDIANRFDLSAVPECVRPFLQVARAISGALPQSSASSITASMQSFYSFVRLCGEDPETTATSPEWLIAYITARSTPPVGVPLPNDPSFRKPVLPTTAVGNVDDMRRGARLGIASLQRWKVALNDDSLLGFCKEIGARVGKLRTEKRPFLFKEVEKAWALWGPDGAGKGTDRQAVTALRDACSIVLGFFYGCRAQEITSFQYQDIRVAGDTVHLSFRSRKNRRSVLGLHQPQTIVASHPLLVSAMTLWLSRAKSLGASGSTPLFPKTEKGTGPISFAHAAAMSPASIRFRCREIDPKCVAHSLRAGLATEAWAAGVPVEAIMALGGWTSPVAIMYIIGATDETVSASRRLGSAGMHYDGADLRASLGTSRLQRSTWQSWS